MGLTECTAEPETDGNTSVTVLEMETKCTDWDCMKPIAAVRFPTARSLAL